MHSTKFIISKYNFDNPEKDLDEILSFYENNKSDAIKEREIIDLIRSTKNGQVFRVKDERDNMIAVSCIFTHLNGASEAGGTLVPQKGLRLQGVLHKLRLMHSFLWHDPKAKYFTAVGSDNAKSIHGTQKCGFVDWAPSTSFLAAVGKGVPLPEEAAEQSPQAAVSLAAKSKLRFFDFDRNREGSIDLLKKMKNELMVLHNGQPHVLANGSGVQIIFGIPLFQQKRLLEGLP